MLCGVLRAVRVCMCACVYLIVCVCVCAVCCILCLLCVLCALYLWHGTDAVGKLVANPEHNVTAPGFTSGQTRSCRTVFDERAVPTIAESLRRPTQTSRGVAWRGVAWRGVARRGVSLHETAQKTALH